MPKKTLKDQEEVAVDLTTGANHPEVRTGMLEPRPLPLDASATIAHPSEVNPNLAKGIQSESLEKPKTAEEKLAERQAAFTAGVDVDTSMIEKAYRFAGPLALEVGVPIATAIAASPLLVQPIPGSRLAYFSMLGGVSSLSNNYAQQMRIGFGDQKEFSWEENVAAGAFGLVPGFKSTKDMSKVAMMSLRAGEGALMATGETALRQSMEIAAGNREGGKGVAEELLGAAGIGTLLGGGLGRLEKALMKQTPKDTPASLLRNFLKSEVKEAEKALKAARKTKDNDKIQDAQEWVMDSKEKLEKVTPKEEVILAAAIKKLEEDEAAIRETYQEFALENRKLSESEDIAAPSVKAEEGVTAQPEGVAEGGAKTERKTGDEIPLEPDEPTQQRIREEADQILKDFMEGRGTREVGIDPNTGEEIAGDAADEIKARLLSNDADVQRMINVVQDHMKDELKKVKGKVSVEEFLERVAVRVKRTMGAEDGDAFQMLLKSKLTAETTEMADAVEDITIRMGATAAIIDTAFTKLTSNLQKVDISDAAALNDAMVAVNQTIPLMLEWKRLGSASGRLLAVRKYVKDAGEARYLEAEKQMESSLVKNLKKAEDLTPEQLEQQIATFGELQTVKRLVKAIQQADKAEDVKRILMDQQQAFQTTSSIKDFFGLPKRDASGKVIKKTSRYAKVRDVGIDMAYFNMLTAPVTHAKALIGNLIMQYYHPFLGYVGAKYMAVAPWTRRGKSKAEYQAAATFWKETGINKAAKVYGNLSSLAWIEAKRAFKSGDADLASHFERVGSSALSMERTGLDGALGQSLENAGQFVDLPGKTLGFIDMYSKQRLAHAMAYAKAHGDWEKAQKAGQVVPPFDDYYNAFVKKIFAENRLKTEDTVRREAVRLAEEKGIPLEDYPEFIDTFVKENWDKSTSDFVSFIQRQSKEISFQEELGEFTDINKVEEFFRKGEAALRDLSPIVQTAWFPFMRTGRNMIREAISHSAFIAETPLLGKHLEGMWAKTMQDLNSGDPIRASRAKGRQIVGAGLIAAFWALHEEGTIVGKQEQNWRKRENLERGEGQGDYEIRFRVGPNPNDVVGIDYRALEPFSTIAGMVCDAKTIWQTGNEEQKNEVVIAMQALSLTLANNITNKSYFKNLGDMLKIVTDAQLFSEGGQIQKERKLKGMLSILVPSGMNAVAMATDNERRRGDKWLQVIGKRIAGIAAEVPPYRDLFGDVTPLHPADFEGTGKAAQVFSLINPFPINKKRMETDDYVVTDEKGFRSIDVSAVDLNDKKAVRNAAWAIMIELGGEYHFPGPKKDGISLDEIRNPEGQDAYDRWQELFSEQKIDGLDVKQAIVVALQDYNLEQIKSVPKAEIPEGVQFEDLRNTIVTAILGQYRDAAYEELKYEFVIIEETLEEAAYRQEDFNYGEPNLEKSPLERFFEEANPPDPLQERLQLYPSSE